MEIFAVIVVGVFIICSGIAVFFMIRNVRTLKKKDEIHFSGGADTDRGYISYDNNFFKGTGNFIQETMVIGRSASLNSVSFTVNRSAPITVSLRDNQLVFGRDRREGIYTIAGDPMISKLHCRLFRYNGALYLEDLNSSNHTFLNGSMIYAAMPVNQGDMIRIGNTELIITGI